MTTETLMTEASQTPTEGQSSQATESTATAAAADGQQQQAVEGQAAEGQKAEGEQQQSEEAKPEGAPEKYEFKAPEGKEFDAAVIENFSEVAKELNLSQDAAQKILDKMGPTIAARQAEQVEAVRNEWANASKSDKEFGGEKLQENLGVAKKALDTFATPELRSLLNESGLGNHPEVIRFMYRAGMAISEDGFVTGKASKASDTSMAQRMYPNMNP
jgi:hypothetical protein